jgi:hypothetical protein
MYIKALLISGYSSLTNFRYIFQYLFVFSLLHYLSSLYRFFTFSSFLQVNFITEICEHCDYCYYLDIYSLLAIFKYNLKTILDTLNFIIMLFNTFK